MIVVSQRSARRRPDYMPLAWWWTLFHCAGVFWGIVAQREKLHPYVCRLYSLDPIRRNWCSVILSIGLAETCWYGDIYCVSIIELCASPESCVIVHAVCISQQVWITKGSVAEMDLSHNSLQVIGVLACLGQIFKTG